jgi:hypothetical protein
MTGREELRDRHGNLIGAIERNGSKRVLRDEAGNRLGYDSHSGGPVTSLEILWAEVTCSPGC